MMQYKSAWRVAAVGAWMVGACAVALAQESGRTAAIKPSDKAEKHRMFYALENESFGDKHRQSASFQTDPRTGTSVRVKILLVAPNVGNRTMAKQISKTHRSLRKLNVEPIILWQRAADDKNRREYARIASEKQAAAMVKHYANRPRQQLNVFVVELDVDLDGDGESDPSVGVRLPSVDAASVRVDAILVDSAVLDTYQSTLSHAIGHFLGLVSAQGSEATYAFRQDGARTGCKACLKSVGASPAP